MPWDTGDMEIVEESLSPFVVMLFCRQAAGGGCFSSCGSWASTQAHGGALDVQIVIAGRANSGSSKLPPRTKIRCGRASA